DRKGTFVRNKTSRALIGLAIAGAGLLTACSGDDPLAAQAGNSGGKNYIAGDGSVMELAVEERGETVEFSGETFDGETISTDSLDGPTLELLVRLLRPMSGGSPRPCESESRIL